MLQSRINLPRRNFWNSSLRRKRKGRLMLWLSKKKKRIIKYKNTKSKQFKNWNQSQTKQKKSPPKNIKNQNSKLMKMRIWRLKECWWWGKMQDLCRLRRLHIRLGLRGGTYHRRSCRIYLCNWGSMGVRRNRNRDLLLTGRPNYY